MQHITGADIATAFNLICFVIFMVLTVTVILTPLSRSKEL